MKKAIILGMLVAFFVGISVISYAEEKGSMMGKEKKGSMKGKGYMQCMMMKKMMKKEIVATGDGGVIVFVGNKLMKYDKDLNLIKEVEIQVDMEAMMKKCREMMKKCRMGEGSEETVKGSER